MERQRFKTKQAATGAALFLAPWLDDLLRLLGVVGDAKDVGGLVLGIPPAFLFLLVQWAVATAGVAFMLFAVMEPLAARGRQRSERRRGAEALRRRQRDIRDYLTASHQGVRSAIGLFIAGPREVDAGGTAAELLVTAGLIEAVGHTIKQGQRRVIYRLTEAARPVVEEIVRAPAGLPPTTSPPPSSPESSG